MIRQQINHRLLSHLFLFFLLFAPTVALAGYSPSSRKPPTDHSRAGGSRGCPGESIILTTLAPNTYVGTTSSLRPTFAWFASKSQTTEFRLFELNTNNSTKQIGSPQKLMAKSGINQLTFPESLPPLTVGKKYLWQVSIDCQDGPLVQRVELEVVQKTPNLLAKLSNITDKSQKANIYAEEGLWYEAFEEALKVAPQGKLGQVGTSLVKNLAQWDNFIVEVAPMEQTARKKEIQKRIKNLESIIHLD